MQGRTQCPTSITSRVPTVSCSLKIPFCNVVPRERVQVRKQRKKRERKKLQSRRPSKPVVRHAEAKDMKRSMYRHHYSKANSQSAVNRHQSADYKLIISRFRPGVRMLAKTIVPDVLLSMPLSALFKPRFRSCRHPRSHWSSVARSAAARSARSAP